MADTKAPEGTPADTSPEPASGRSVWSRPGFVLSLALVAALVVGAVWLAVDDPDPAAPGAPHATSAVVRGTEDACGPDSGRQVPPTSAPDTDWVLLGSMASPTSPSAGPADEADGVPVCFSPDPTGALFAAATYVAGFTDPDLRRPLLELSTAETPARHTALTYLDQEDEGPTSGVQIAGFTFQSYRPGEAATVDLALAYKGSFVHLPVQLLWAGRDWLVELPVTGRLADSIAALPDAPGLPAGYVPWQGA